MEVTVIRPLLKENSGDVEFMQYMWSGSEVQARESAGVAQEVVLDWACRGPHTNGHNLLKSQPNWVIRFSSRRIFPRGFKNISMFCYYCAFRDFFQPGTPSCMFRASGEVGNPSQVPAHTSAADVYTAKKQLCTNVFTVEKNSQQSGP